MVMDDLVDPSSSDEHAADSGKHAGLPRTHLGAAEAHRGTEMLLSQNSPGVLGVLRSWYPSGSGSFTADEFLQVTDEPTGSQYSHTATPS